MTDDQLREIARRHLTPSNTNMRPWDDPGVIEAMREAVAAERERCAKVCEKDFELFEDGVSADLGDMGILTVAEAYMRGMEDMQELNAAAIRSRK